MTTEEEKEIKRIKQILARGEPLERVTIKYMENGKSHTITFSDPMVLLIWRKILQGAVAQR